MVDTDRGATFDAAWLSWLFGGGCSGGGKRSAPLLMGGWRDGRLPVRVVFGFGWPR